MESKPHFVEFFYLYLRVNVFTLNFQHVYKIYIEIDIECLEQPVIKEQLVSNYLVLKHLY